jgi:hypothetical protein
VLVEEFILHPSRIQFRLKADFILVDPFAWFYCKFYIIGSDWGSASQSQQNDRQLTHAISTTFGNSNTILSLHATRYPMVRSFKIFYFTETHYLRNHSSEARQFYWTYKPQYSLLATGPWLVNRRPLLKAHLAHLCSRRFRCLWRSLTERFTRETFRSWPVGKEFQRKILLRNIHFLEAFGKSSRAISSALIHNSVPNWLMKMTMFYRTKNKKRMQ